MKVSKKNLLITNALAIALGAVGVISPAIGSIDVTHAKADQTTSVKESIKNVKETLIATQSFSYIQNGAVVLSLKKGDEFKLTQEKVVGSKTYFNVSDSKTPIWVDSTMLSKYLNKVVYDYNAVNSTSYAEYTKYIAFLMNANYVCQNYPTLSYQSNRIVRVNRTRLATFYDVNGKKVGSKVQYEIGRGSIYDWESLDDLKNIATPLTKTSGKPATSNHLKEDKIIYNLSGDKIGVLPKGTEVDYTMYEASGYRLVTVINRGSNFSHPYNEFIKE